MRLPLWITIPLVFTSALTRADGPHPKPGPGINISVHDGQVDIDGLGDYIDSQLDQAMDKIDDADLPPAVRAKLKAHLGEMRAKLGKRLSHLNAKDMQQLGEELGQMGDELGKELGDDVARELKDAGMSLGKGGSGFHVHVDADDDDDGDVGDLPGDDDDDLDDAARDLGDLSLTPAQRQAIQKLRTDSDQQVKAAKQALAAASKQLRQDIDNAATSDAELSKAIDAVAQQEAAIRKARILAWHAARRVLDDAQRKKVEGAAKGNSK